MCYRRYNALGMNILYILGFYVEKMIHTQSPHVLMSSHVQVLVKLISYMGLLSNEHYIL